MTGSEATETEGSGNVFERLLSVQDHDTVIDQRRHRRATLPEQAELAVVERRLAAVSARAAEVQSGRDELGVRQGALEDLIEAARKRREELEKRMYGGQVSAARDLQAMDDEVRHLKQHISELEDREIEIMEQLEPVDTELAAAGAEGRTLEGERERLRQAVTSAVTAIDADIRVRSEDRAAAAATVPPDLLARYEKLRTTLSGTGAARLVGGSCSGCHLALPAMEVDRIRKAPPDEVILCDQCGRILVR
ncbi:MAG: zinc ribbon domain-containing protein [Acidimicrobiales bacterium]